MFNINSWEMLVLVALFVMLFGPDRLPKVIGQVVKLLRDLQQMSDSATADLRRELEAATQAVDLTTPSKKRSGPTGAAPKPEKAPAEPDSGDAAAPDTAPVSASEGSDESAPASATETGPGSTAAPVVGPSPSIFRRASDEEHDESDDVPPESAP